ncbi:hypothetical protein [Streptomyces sp. NPDC060035]|uniref:hypothetical protein n=1 Tax=Streptomyces sp. NPDC060035 TaxID=3347044 RepID=UPI0036D06F5C
MSERPDGPGRRTNLWQTPAAPDRWVIWNTGGESMVFDKELNIPAEVSDADLRDVLRSMRAAGVPEDDEYPGRPCG